VKGRVTVSQHAVSRAHDRYRGVFADQHGAACRQIVREVASAIDAGRMSVHMPRFAVRRGCTRRSHAGHYGLKYEPSMRYVWTEDRARLYVVRRGRPTVVVTCFRPDAAAEAA
jgi:hypothetical protein